MPDTIRDELKAFDRDLAKLVARFLRLYERLEGEVRRDASPPSARTTLRREPLQGYE